MKNRKEFIFNIVKVIFEVEKSSTTILRIAIINWGVNKTNFIDVRKWWKKDKKDKEYFPGKGISLSFEDAQIVLQNLQKAIEVYD